MAEKEKDIKKDEKNEKSKSATELMLMDVAKLSIQAKDSLNNLAITSSDELKASIEKDRETLDLWMRVKGKSGDTELHPLPTPHGAEVFDVLPQNQKDAILKKMPESSRKTFLNFVAVMVSEKKKDVKDKDLGLKLNEKKEIKGSEKKI